MALDPELEELDKHSGPHPNHPSPLVPPRPAFAERAVAFFEVLLCSDYLTQIGLGGTLITLGYSPLQADGGFSLQYVVLLSLIDTVLLVGLILLFLRIHGEHPRTVLFGSRSLVREAVAGVGLTLVAFGIAVAVLGIILQFAPQLHTVANNPLQALMRNPRDIVIFAVVVVLAGGVREELQRGFLLHRFEQWLGGRWVGLVVTSAAFGFGHLTQGVDATIATALLGAFWGVVYLRRRSVMAPIVSHSGFNLLQLLQYLAFGR